MSPAEVVALVLELARVFGVPAARAIAEACALRPELRDVEIPEADAELEAALSRARERVASVDDKG